MSEKTRRRDAAKESFWRRTIKKRERSGLTIRAFCEREGLTESAYQSWRRELLKRDGVATKEEIAADIVSRDVLQHEHYRRNVIDQQPGWRLERDGALVKDDDAYRLAPPFDELKPSYQDVIRFRVLEGHPTSVVAELMKKTPANVDTTFHRALCKVRELVKQRGWESTDFRP